MPTQQQLANAIRILSMDAVQKANSGHPGMPMGMADIATVLWRDFLKHNPHDPQWIDRDRFVLSNGHGSMLLYSLLHLTGYDLSLEEIKNFRQLHSKTPGHPEYGLTPGVETTTGPLGQGLANAVGMALAERTLAAQFNQADLDIINHYTYVFMGDGCLMEGISHEACSLAGTLGLGKLIGFWDNNGISIDGDVSGWFTDNTPQRFEAYGWHVVADVDGHDPDAIKHAIIAAQSMTTRPSLICCKTEIAYGAPNLSGSEKSHGAALGEDEVALARAQLDWSHPAFEIPTDIYQAWDAREKGREAQQSWHAKWQRYQQTHQHMAAEFNRRIAQQLPKNWQALCQQFITQQQAKQETVATRKASLHALNALGPALPELIGGSADLSGSNCTLWSGAKVLSQTASDGNYLHFGVREFAMFAMMNGLALHGGFIPYGGTFLTFTDYGRNAIRLSAMMHQRVIYVLTHDSIGLGEDGPTHQPVEHLNTLRNTPNVITWRPCDATETAVAWQQALACTNGPTCLTLSRGNLPAQQRDEATVSMIARGGYVLMDSHKQLDAIIIATGSEVDLAVQAAQQLQQQDIGVRVVSMPSTEIFAQQDQAYIESVLPDKVNARLAIEAGATHYWYQYVGRQGKVIGIDRFGESAPAKAVFAALGFTVEQVVESVQALLAEKQSIMTT